jgi:hypothetical protein
MKGNIMAKASVEYREIQVIDLVNLTLNENELKLLMTVLGYVGGSPDESPRKYSDSIYRAIRNLKLGIGDFNKELDPNATPGIYFK